MLYIKIDLDLLIFLFFLFVRAYFVKLSLTRIKSDFRVSIKNVSNPELQDHKKSHIKKFYEDLSFSFSSGIHLKD